jgi:hypothetical protein
MEREKLLVKALRKPTPVMEQTLDYWKRESYRMKKDDYVWHALLVSASTMGNSRGYEGLILNTKTYDKVAYDTVHRKSLNQKIAAIDFIGPLQEAKVRMPPKKAEYLNTNFHTIQRMGGAETVKQLILSLSGRQRKIDFMKKTFAGIGDFYARNIWMDVYHSDFRDSIAINKRIKQVSMALGLRFNSYHEHEQYYLQLARKAGLEGWALDRLLHNHLAEFLAVIS